MDGARTTTTRLARMSRSRTRCPAASTRGTCTWVSAVTTAASSEPPGAYKPLEVGGNGRAESDAELSVPFPVAGQYFINVHASRNNMSTIIACGNLAPPSR